jgi:phage shock protein C
MERKLYRIPDQAVFGGVSSGLAQYFQIDVVIIRVLFVVMLLLPIPPSFGWTGILYIILWAVLPTGPAIADASSTAFDFMPKSSEQGSDKKRSEQTMMILGAALVFFGVWMLVDHLPIWYQFKRYFWPILLIAIGAFLILRQRDRQQENRTNVDPGPPPPADPTIPVTPEPDPQPYRPFGSADSSASPTDQPGDGKIDDDDDDTIIKVN